ncbi:hypothetical protein ACFC1D_04170 [Streptomyces vinaceus]|uniref:hypothetical protein n=1 Tax=Streptomyces vinaceus TaxID=1960 RepID=UPI0035D77B63
MLRLSRNVLRSLSQSEVSADQTEIEIAVEEARRDAVTALRVGVVPPFTGNIAVVALLVRMMLREELPYPEEAGSRIYVLSFAGPVPYVKIGSSADCEKRISDHELAARNHCYSLVDGWISKPLGSGRDVITREKRLIADLHIALYGSVASRPSEYFHQVDFYKIVSHVMRSGISGMPLPRPATS